VAKKASTVYDIPESSIAEPWNDYGGIARWIAEEIDRAREARGNREQEVRYAWALYEQQRTRARMPWPGAADLTSPMSAEYVDSLHARLMTTIFTEPVWSVEGWGASAAKAPFVEEFHQRAQEDERLQGYADAWFLRALVEGVGTLEVSESVQMRRERRTMRAKVQVDPVTGSPVMGEDVKPLLMRDETQQFMESGDPNEPSAEVEVDELVPDRLGPAYDVIPYSEFLTMPAHARDTSKVWGRAKRFWRRVPELQARAKMGIYDAKAVEALGTDNERHTDSYEAPQHRSIATQDGPTAQKELWDVQVYADFDGRGERWWRATVHKDTNQLLRLRIDDRTTRFIQYFPFPRPHSVDHGYSLVIDKLITVVEEDTAVRNMRADRGAMKASQPVKRLAGALWDPLEQAMGPQSVIDVRDMNEVQEMRLDDIPQSLIQWKADVRADAERLIGQNEIAQGQQTEERRTLGEVQLQAGYAEVRMKVITGRAQEALEELAQARHAIWRRVLQTRNANAPMLRSLTVGSAADGVDVAGIATDGTITADLLDGIFWFKPRGSVETADLNRQRADFNGFLSVLPALAQMNPMIAQIFQTVPAAKALVKTALKVNRVQDVQSFIGPEAHGVFEQMQIAQDPKMQMLKMLMEAGGGAPGGMPGQPQGPAGPNGGAASGGAPGPAPEGAGELPPGVM